MSRLPRALAGRVIGYYAIRDLIPLYAVYSLLFRDHGVSTGGVSSLLAIWSITAFVTEVPSGAWADAVSRRVLLILSSLLYAVGFSLWMLVPTYAGFAAGFVLWGVSGALMSGTFEAFVYDELAAHGAASSYARLMGLANSSAMVANLLGTVVAMPLFALGGYRLVGWVSVGVALVQALLAASLPPAARAAEAKAEDDNTGVSSPISGSLISRYVEMLRAGLSEVTRDRVVRNAVLISSLLLGFTVYDEYFALVAREKGAATQTVPLLIGLTVAGQAIGTALAGRSAEVRGRTMAWALGIAALLLAIGMAEGQWLGFTAIAVGYGITANAVIVAEARLQDSINGPARATVTSVTGLVSESFAIAVYAAFALGASWFAVSTLAIALAAALMLVATLVPRLLPAPRQAIPSERTASREPVAMDGLTAPTEGTASPTPPPGRSRRS